MRQLSKIIFINIAILSILIIVPAIVAGVAKRTLKNKDQREQLPSLAGSESAKIVFSEYKKLPLNYWSFSGWRRKNIEHELTKIVGEYNTRYSLGHEGYKNNIAFFGGSTMWGVGVSDTETIPSYFYKMNKEISVVNYGESAWNSRQSLNLLIDLIGDNNIPKAIVFYDGINDILGQCRSENSRIPAHSKEGRFNNKLNASFKKAAFNKLSETLLAPYEGLIKNKQIENIDDLYECDNDTKKASKIADHMINNWHVAYTIADKLGINSYFILQPHAHNTKSNTSYLDLQKEVEIEINNQLEIGYKLIKEQIKRKCQEDANFCSKIIDGTAWLDVNENIFIDNSHINAKGNRIIATKITEAMGK